MDDTTEFYKEVGWDEEELNDAEDGDAMISMVDVLQTLGISAGDATAYAVKVIKSRTTQPSSFGPKYQPTFFELYGHGTLSKRHMGKGEISTSMVCMLSTLELLNPMVSHGTSVMQLIGS